MLILACSLFFALFDGFTDLVKLCQLHELVRYRIALAYELKYMIVERHKLLLEKFATLRNL